MESVDWSSSKEAGSMIAITAGSDPTTTNDQRTGREKGAARRKDMEDTIQDIQGQDKSQKTVEMF